MTHMGRRLCGLLVEGKKEGRREGRKEGRKEGEKEIVQNCEEMLQIQLRRDIGHIC